MQEPILRATHYIPELVQLQKQMVEFSNYQLDKDAGLSVCEYMKRLKCGEWCDIYILQNSICHHEIFIILFSLHLIEHEKIQFRHQFKCVRSAWELVKDKLANYSMCMHLFLLVYNIWTLCEHLCIIHYFISTNASAPGLF